MLRIGFAVLSLSFLVTAAAAQPPGPLQWEIERNFRYFLYPSDVAAERVARDILTARNHSAPNPAQIEALMNGGVGFWSTKLVDAGDLRKYWPVDWPRDDTATTLDLVKRLRQEEGRASREPLPANPAELGRLGWASLIARGPGVGAPMGSTDTCWDPAKRLHTACNAVWGDYVRPVGWVVRVFDPDAPSGQTCAWPLKGAVFSAGSLPGRFAASAEQALRGAAAAATQNADCREVRIIVPSAVPDPVDPRRTPVTGQADVQRNFADGRSDRLMVEPRDRLVIGLGDSFTSGEGNPERPARFEDQTWSAVQNTPGGPTRLQSSGAANLPARAPDSTAPGAPDSRAQWTDRWCHRSVYSWQIRAALGLALSDLHQSVTILPYGCSGAEILEGLLYAWNGPEYDPAIDRRLRVIGSRAEIGLAYQELCTAQAYDSTNNLKLIPPTDKAEDAPGFYRAALANTRDYVARCSRTRPNVFKRSADALLLDIGINDVQFSKWVVGLILDKSLLSAPGASGLGFVPCVDAAGAPCDAVMQKAFDRLGRRFALLHDVFADYMLPEFQIAPDHVIAAVYSPELDGCGAGEGESVSGNVGLTVGTEAPPPPLFSFGVHPEACDSASLGWALAGNGAVLAAVRRKADVQSVDRARLLLNKALANFAGSLGHEAHQATLISAFVNDMRDRGFCVTTERASRPPQGHACFTTVDMTDANTIGCAPGDPPSSPESMHVPRATVQLGACPHAQDISSFHPFPPDRFEPYRSRTRLFRTMNDVYMTINQRPPQQVDTAFGILDLTNRAVGGAFHPTAEGHALVATEASAALCKTLGCE